MKASKTIHAVRSAHYAPGSIVRAVCGVMVGENRRTESRRKATCKRCRQLLGMATGPRKPPKRALGRGLTALLGVRDMPEQRAAEAFNAALYFAVDILGAAGGIEFLRLWREGDFDAIRKEFPELKDDPQFDALFRC